MAKHKSNSSGFNTRALDQKALKAREDFLDAIAKGDTEKLNKISLENQRSFVNYRDPRPTHMERTALIYASQNGREDLVRHLLSLDADIDMKDSFGWSALTASVTNKTTWVMEVLLESNADIDSRDNEGWTPLMEALNRDREDIALRLLEKGAGVRPRNNDGMTAMDIAQDKKLEQIVKAIAPILQDMDTQASVSAMRHGTPRKISAPAPARFRKTG